MKQVLRAITLSILLSLILVTFPPITAAAGTGILANVPEASIYTLVYEKDIPVNSSGWNSSPVPYEVNNAAAITEPFDRIAYYWELKKASGATDWVYVSVDAFTHDKNKIGIPNTTAGAFFQQILANMNVYSNVPGIVTGTGITTGNIEFWPSNYGQATTSLIPTGSSSTFDWNDSGASLSNGHGCMQIHNYDVDGAGPGTAGQTLFAYNAWGAARTSELGLGNQPGGAGTNTDWTFNTSNITNYTSRTLQVLVHLVPDLTPPSAPAGLVANAPELSNYWLVYRKDLPNAAAYNSTGVNYNEDYSWLVDTGSFDRVAYYLQLNGNFAEVSFDAAGFTNNATKIGIPNTASGEFYQQNVSNLNVGSNVAGIATGTALTGGNIEFWPGNYGSGNSGVPNATSAFDFGDSGAGTGAGYGSMQVHNHYVTPTTGQTIFAYNRWGGNDGNDDLGIGNRPATADIDWTFAQNAASYTTKSLYVLVLPIRPTTTVVTISPTGQAYLGDPVTFSATVNFGGNIATDASGSIEFCIDRGSAISIPLSSGQASYTTSALTLGSHQYEVFFRPDNERYEASGVYGENNYSVVKKPTTTTLTMAPSGQAYFSDPVTLTATVFFEGNVAADASGTVYFYIDGHGTYVTVPVSSGQATTTISDLTLGTHHIQALFEPDDDRYQGSDSAPEGEAYNIVERISTTTLNMSPSGQAYFTDPVTLTATIFFEGNVAADASGTVYFYIDGHGTYITVPVSSGQATTTISDLTLGTHHIQALFEPDDDRYQGSDSAPEGEAYNIVERISTTTLNMSPSGQAYFTDPVTLTATIFFEGNVAADASGTVYFYIDGHGTYVTVPVSSGQATTTISDLTLGTHHIQALFEPDDDRYQGSQSSSEGEAYTIVKRLTTTTLTISPPSPAYIGTAVTYTATVLVNGTVATDASGRVHFAIDGQAIEADVTLSSGQASFTTSALGLGAHRVSAVAFIPVEGCYEGSSVNVNGLENYLIIDKLNQTINFGALSNKTIGDGDFTINATASSGLPVSFTASGPCTLAGNTVHITGEGICTLTAHQGGNGIYHAAPNVAQTFSVYSTYDNLENKVTEYVTKADMVGSLLAKLDNIEKANAAGNASAKAGMIKAFINQVQAQTGKSISAENAEILISLTTKL